MISVIIPTHNRKELLQRALNSVWEQTVKDLEIIVVSDGSTDGTKEYLEAYQKDEDRLRFIEYTENKGANYARNMGIKMQGENILHFWMMMMNGIQ